MALTRAHYGDLTVWALSQGNHDGSFIRYDCCFGGRRIVLTRTREGYRTRYRLVADDEALLEARLREWV